MRVLVVSGSADGGSARTTDELALRLIERGHDLLVVRSASRPVCRVSHQHVAGRLVRRLRREGHDLGRRLRRPRPWDPARVEDRSGVPVLSVPYVGPAGRRLVGDWRPDAVLAVSMGGSDWPEVRAGGLENGVPVLLLVHEASSLLRLDDPVRPPDRLVVNAEAHARVARAGGHDPIVIGSVVEAPSRPAERPSTGVVLFINPIPEYGLDLMWDVAGLLPDMRFAFQESWPLTRADRRALRRRAARLGNVDVRPFRPAAEVYVDARVLAVPYLDGNRPRVVAEAHGLGLPVVARATSGLVEAVGATGVLLPAGAGPDQWAEQLAVVGEDPVPTDDGADPAEVAARVEQLLEQSVASLA